LPIAGCRIAKEDERAEMINSLSVVLAITFGSATIFLLGDAQGPAESLGEAKFAGYSLVKIAHHGSSNGLGANVLTRKEVKPHCFNHGIVTPYTRSDLPRRDMLLRYTEACAKLVHTNTDSKGSRPARAVPGMTHARLPHSDMSWIGIEVSSNGTLKQFL